MSIIRQNYQDIQRLSNDKKNQTSKASFDGKLVKVESAQPFGSGSICVVCLPGTAARTEAVCDKLLVKGDTVQAVLDGDKVTLVSGSGSSASSTSTDQLSWRYYWSES